MSIRNLSLAAVMLLAASAPALAQTAAGGGSAEGNMNNPGSVKSDSEKMTSGQGGAAGAGMTTGTAGPKTGGDMGNAKSGDGVTGNAGARTTK
ncbi:hypothetical protein [Methylobacterium sp. J-070]|uniref:hypothetical protein n=1 Tax=Methylobacterium sp. J-070 TaxID=2836650 RepID=UPI001FB8DAD5|nr:hypothetical protein [Methylobacterium sp. J-070]MCJ2050675.1 hypothetical protein [Methylobacterium sp. J-070]